MSTKENRISSMTPSTRSRQPTNLRLWSATKPNLSGWIQEAVDGMGFEHMTPVQASTIPLFMGNKDVVVEAVTGSGKTLAFLIPLVERLLRVEEPIKKNHIGAIIISPTRELAVQIYDVLLELLAYHEPSASVLNFRHREQDIDVANGEPQETEPEPGSDRRLKVVPQLLVSGKFSPPQDLATFLRRETNLVIGTPGRLLQLLSSSHVHCPQSSFDALVLDEADRLLDLGFKDDLQKILQRLPKQRRTGLFSASVSEAVDQIIRIGLRNPVRISVKVKDRNGEIERRTPATLKMAYLITKPDEKFPALLEIINRIQPRPTKTIAYVSTCAAVDYFSAVVPPVLSSNRMGSDVRIIPLHSRLTPQHRTKNYETFQNSVAPTVLLATDVAARGLDISGVDLTVQLDPPSDPKTFIHRAGRAGRAGKEGLAVVFLLPGREADEYPSFLQVRKTPISALTIKKEGTVSLQETQKATPSALVSDEQRLSFSRGLREVVLTDRTLHDKSQRALVSFARSYVGHAASSIFRMQELPWRELGRAWGLLKLPRMPELKKKNRRQDDAGDDILSNLTVGDPIDWSNYSYRDPAKEAKRQRESTAVLEHGKELVATQKQVSNGQTLRTLPEHLRRKEKAWTRKRAQHENTVTRREQRQAKKAKLRQNKMTEAERRKELETERLVEEVRKKVVTQRTVEAEEFGGFDD